MTENIQFPIGSSGCFNSEELRLSIHDSIQLVNREVWDSFVQNAGVFFSYEYLIALEKAMLDSMEFRYVTYYCPNYEPLGIGYFQVVDLIDNGSKYRDSVEKLGPVIGSRIVKEMKLRSLVAGNVFHCGDNGFYFNSKLSDEQAIQAIESTMDRLKKGSHLHTKVSIVLFKEFWPEQKTEADKLIKRRFHPFPMDVNMVLDIRPKWTTFDNYLSDMTSKARTRVKGILKKSSELEIRPMEANEIQKFESKMDELFLNVLEHSPFIFGRLEMKVYPDWKRELGDKLMFHGIFLDGKMVGFNSAFVNGDILDVHYVGIDYDLNKDHMIYQRMLLDFLQFAINKGLKRIIYGRTAEQAKSSIGAEPVSMTLYTKHRNPVANRLIGPLMSSVKETEYELRRPFKVESDG